MKRFLDAHNQMYLKALEEIKNGQKITHWMWYIFPQLKGLGQSETAKFYAINNMQEATLYLEHPVLGKHLIEISNALLNHKTKSATEILGHPDDLKLRSSMTLFAKVHNTDTISQLVLNQFYKGSHDESTLQLLLLE